MLALPLKQSKKRSCTLLAGNDVAMLSRIEDDLLSFRNGIDNFGRETAALRENLLQPVSWWEKYGSSAPTLVSKE